MLELTGTLTFGNADFIIRRVESNIPPQVLILDEPTQGVDVGAKSEIHKIIRRLAREGIAVILISSDLPEVIGMSDRIGVMRGGRLVEVLPGGSDASTVMAAALGRSDVAGKEGA